MRATGSAEFFDREARIPRVEQDSVNVGGDRLSLPQRIVIKNVNDLNDSYARQGPSKLLICVDGHSIDELKRVDAGLSLLSDDGISVLFARQEK
jgi:hypothetical protein